MLDLAGGGFAELQLMLSNLGIGDGHAAARAVVVTQEGSWSATAHYERAEWSYRAPDVLTIGNSSLCAADGTVEVHLVTTPVKVHARLAGALSETRPPGYRAQVAASYFEHRVLVPWAPVRVEIEAAGRRASEVAAFGSLDHFRATALPSKLWREWVRLYGLGPAGALLLMARLPPQGGAAVGWVWGPGAAEPRALERLQLGGARTGERSLEGGAGDLSLRLRTARQLHRHAPLEQLGWLRFLVRALVGNPVTRTYRATIESATAPAPPTAILELTADE